MQARRYPGIGLILAGVIPALLVPGVAALFYFVICRNAPAARWIYSGAKLFLVVWPFLWWLVARPPRSMRRRRGPAWWRVWLEGLASGLVMAGAVWLAVRSPLGERLYAASGAIRDRVQHLGVAGHYIAFVAALSLVNSLIEEYYWRWFVFGRLRSFLTPWPAAAVASLAFAAQHAIVTGRMLTWPLGLLCGAGVFLAGFVWSLQFDRHRSLVGVWFSHVVVDVTVFVIGWQVLRAGG